jgi:two-component system nitrogen regulation sensor histidine kinase NtrY
MDTYLNNQVVLRNLSEAIIFDGTGEVLAKSRFAFAVTFTNLRSDWVDRAREGEIVLLRSDDTNKLRAVVKLTSYVDAYLFVGRFIDKSVLEAVDTTRLAASDYQQIGIRQLDLQVSFAFLFGLVLLLLLIAALWIGLNLANAIVEPLGSVISVAEQVRSGDLSQRVPENLELEEISQLGASFNRMLDQLTRSREQLVQANTQLDRRREFTEAVLGGVSSGVIGLDRDGKVTLPNAAALALLGLDDVTMIGMRLDDVVPEFKSLLTVVGRKMRRLTEEQIVLSRGANRLTIRAKIASEIVDGRIIGYVVTFDDVTDLLNAQRKAAWSDIARRIAHEIKNPLTPIQLASDRLLRKFKPDDSRAAEQFTEYLSIISRQVGDIGRMVDEFSAFARMPQPVMQPVSMRELVAGQANLFETETLAVSVTAEPDDQPFTVFGDPGLLRQALTNLIQNAADSMADAGTPNPRIDLSLSINNGFVIISVADNGAGFPDMDLNQLLEPYVTKREKGTGLGLAIVSKIVEDHAGGLVLGSAGSAGSEGGALVTMRIPMFDTQQEAKG